MSTAAAIAMLSAPPAEPTRTGADVRAEPRADSGRFDRHLDVARSDDAGAASSSRSTAAPSESDAPERSEDCGGMPEAELPESCPTPEDTIDPLLAAEMAALNAPATLVLPAPILDPLSDIPALAVVVGSDSATDAAGSTMIDLKVALDAALAASRTEAAQALAGAEPTATAVADGSTPTGAAAALLAAASVERDGERLADSATAVTAEGDGVTPATATTAPPLATVRPRDNRFERDAAPEVLTEAVQRPASGTTEAPAVAARPSEAVPALGAAGERPLAGARIESASAPVTSTTSEPGRAATAMDRAVANQVSRAMLTRGADGERMMVLRLTPPELGTVRIEVMERAGVLTARIHAEDEAVRGALERSLPQLRQDLRANDAPVRDVSLADAWNSFSDRQNRNGPGERERRRRDDDAPAFSIDGVAPMGPAPRQASRLGGLVDSHGVDARA